MWRYLLLSLVIHGLFVLLFFLPKRTPTQPTTTVQVEFLEQPKASQGSASGAKKSGKSLTLKNLVPGFKIGPAKVRATGGFSKEISNEDEVGEFAGQMGVKTQLETMHFYQAVWNKINEKFYFPTELSDMYMEGDVVAHIEVDRRGTFKGRLLKLEAHNDLLKAFVLAVIFQGLKYPLHKAYWHSSQELIPLSLTFHFGFYLDGKKDQQGGIMKNRLHFERWTQKEPKVNKIIRDFLTEYYIPLLIPLPGGAMVDIVQVMQLIQRIGKPGPKEQEQIQRNKLKEQFEATIKEVQH